MIKSSPILTSVITAIVLLAIAPSLWAAPARFVIASSVTATALPSIVLPYDAEKKTGFDWQRLSGLNFYQAETESQLPVLSATRYLGEAVKRMTGRELPVESRKDLGSGIVLTTLALAPVEIQRDPAVLAALRNTGEDAYNANEAFFVRTEAKRVLIVANTMAGLGHGVVELLESVGYEVLGMGPNWTHVPDHHGKPLAFSLEKAGRPGFYIRDLWATSSQEYGLGTLFMQPLPDPADETVEVSYNRWRMGMRLPGRSMPAFPGHSWQKYHRLVADKMLELRSEAGFLTRKTTLGLDANRPPATAETAGDIWIDTDAQPPADNGKPSHARLFVSDGKTWTERDMVSASGGAKLDVSVPLVRQIILDDLKQKAEAHFLKEPREPLEKILVFGTDPEDEDKPIELLRNKNWYPEYLAKEGVAFGKPYALNGFKGLNQPKEIWDAGAKTDTVFALNNWLLREFDKWIDAMPSAQRLKDGVSKKTLVRTSLYSYSNHDVPPNFNLDPRIRVMIAGYPQHRGFGKWKNFASSSDMAQAFRVLLPREPSGDYWILSISAYNDLETRGIRGSYLSPSLYSRLIDGYRSGFRAMGMEMDFNFGRQGLEYYLYSKLLWNPKLTLPQLEALRERWLRRAYGSGSVAMKKYYDFMAPENYTVNAPNVWAKATRFIEEADAKIDATREPEAQKRLDDLKQFWYFYYLVESGQGTATSPALKEFLWKGQMSYMTAMHAVSTKLFGSFRIRQLVGETLSTGPAHYTEQETAAWWKQVLEFWPLKTVGEFGDAVLANGVKARVVDLKDLVAVREFQSATPDAAFFYNSGDQRNASVLTVATKAGETIGFKLYWPYDAADINYRDKNVKYGIRRWDAAGRQWQELVDETMVSQQSVTKPDSKGKPQQLVEVRYKAPGPGTYRMDVGYGGQLASLTSLNYELETGTYADSNGLSKGFAFYSTQAGLTQNETYIYIPKGTKSFDLEVWGPPGTKQLTLFKGLPGKSPAVSRTIEIVKKGTQTVPLLAGEDGTVARLSSDGFYFPFLYSVPLIWAKSPGSLLVPRAIALADGLAVLN